MIKRQEKEMETIHSLSHYFFLSLAVL
ncbi:unnamed protein product [Nezara viridula]|uniref:Uncharacterized protein n=1 Tax=Nezara viridula TaxID=85310 RepID=A0A9P0HG19_NEZVI|nr:unnamed protein product [Nezara viridula]